MADKSSTIAGLLLSRNSIVQQVSTNLDELYKSIISDPYKNVSELSEYFKAYDKNRLPSICGKILTQLTDIFVDLVPGYKINTSEQDNARLTKDIYQTALFEKTYLKFYCQFLNLLFKIQKDILKNEDNKKKENKSLIFKFKCLCVSLEKLFSNMSHFNESGRLFELVISTIIKIEESTEYNSLFVSLESYFKAEKNIDDCLSIINLIVSYTKQYKIPPRLIDTFTSLNLDVADENISGKNHKVGKAKKKQHIKKEQPLSEKKDFIKEKNKKIKKAKSQIFNMIFVIYFKILKDLNSNKDIISSVLQGISQFADKVNYHIYVQMIGLIKVVLKNNNLKPVDKLNMTLIMLKLPKIPVSFELDKDFLYEIIYQTMFDIINDAEFDSNFNLLVQVIQKLIVQKSKEVGIKRIFAFTKRLMSLALFTQFHQSTQIHQLIHEIYKKNPQLSRLVDSQSNVGVLYLADVEHPEHCCPDGIILWEHHLFQNHVSTYFRTATNPKQR